MSELWLVCKGWYCCKEILYTMCELGSLYYSNDLIHTFCVYLIWQPLFRAHNAYTASSSITHTAHTQHTHSTHVPLGTTPNCLNRAKVHQMTSLKDLCTFHEVLHL